MPAGGHKRSLSSLREHTSVDPAEALAGAAQLRGETASRLSGQFCWYVHRR